MTATTKRPRVKTLNADMSDADLCRANGWAVGTRLTGTWSVYSNKESTAIITITAVGEEMVLAKADNGFGEIVWTLRHRAWREVS